MKEARGRHGTLCNVDDTERGCVGWREEKHTYMSCEVVYGAIWRVPSHQLASRKVLFGAIISWQRPSLNGVKTGRLLLAGRSGTISACSAAVVHKSGRII